MDLLPKPAGTRLPLLITGGSQQSPEWIARHGDGWMLYPRDVSAQAHVIGAWRTRVREAGQPEKPVMQALYVDLDPDPSASPRPIHLGFRTGTRYLIAHLAQLRAAGVNHVALNLRFDRADLSTTLERLAQDVLPHFHGDEPPVVPVDTKGYQL